MHRLYLSIISVLVAAVVYLALKQGVIGGHQSIAADLAPRALAVLQFVPIEHEPDNTLAEALSNELIDDLVGLRESA